MRKVILAVMLAIASCTCAFAQKGSSAAGINLGAGIGLGDASDYSNINLGFKYQRFVSNSVRLEGVLDYGFGINKDFGYGVKAKTNVFTYGVNLHWIVNPGSSFKFYPIVGFGGGTLKAKASSESVSISGSSTGFMYNVGVGGECPLSEKFALSLEIKFQSIVDDGSYNQLPIFLGCVYKF